jgi:hypothetical protein
MIRLKFLKEDDNKWYVVLPEWDGSKEDLEMVLGADMMLDIFAQGEFEVDLVISTDNFEGSQTVLTFNRNEDGGAWYDAKTMYSKFEVWLCKVTKFIFGELPKTIYMNK